MQTLEFRAMNTSVMMAAEGHDWAVAGLQETRRFIEQCELRFSRFLPDSELSQLNRSAGEWSPVSDDLLEMLVASLDYYKETDGLFDPSILPDLKRAGYDKTMDDIRASGAAQNAAPSARDVRPALDKIEIDRAGRRIRLPRGMEIDLGGIAKGWIVSRAAELLGSYAAVCAVSAGGDIRFIGEPLDGSKWRVELEDPRQPSRSLAVLYVGQSAVVTSSVAKRTWYQNGRARHHLIDPRTGEPAQTDWLSVTVIGPDILAAEVYAKAMLIGGEEAAARLAVQRPELAFITVDRHGRLLGSQTSEEYLSDFNYLYH
jgi:thiamine biosynthesis lipoprotein